MRFVIAIGAALVAATLGLTATQGNSPALVPDSPGLLIMRFHNSPLSDALELLAQRTGIKVQLAADVPDLEKRPVVTVDLKDVSVEDALALLLKSASLTYMVIDEKTVLVLRKTVPPGI